MTHVQSILSRIDELAAQEASRTQLNTYIEVIEHHCRDIRCKLFPNGTCMPSPEEFRGEPRPSDVNPLMPDCHA